MDELFVRKLASKWRVNGMPKEDLEQEFRIIYEKCEKNFDPSKETKFSTYFINACRNKVWELRKKYIPLPVEDLSEYVAEPETDRGLSEEVLDYVEKMKHGDIIKEYYIKNKSQEEIAKARGVSQPYIARLLKEGLEELKRVFNS